MSFAPGFSISPQSPPEGRTELQITSDLKASILELVKLRHDAIRNGERETLDATYDGLDSRDYSLQRDDHERTSYYDWYMNRIERGLGAEITAIHLVPVYDFGALPFPHNANWTIHQPEFELQIETKGGQVSWFVRRDILASGELRVVLPNFAEAPWKTPVLETRGGTVEFNSKEFAKTLGQRVGLELGTWATRLNGLVRIRAFAFCINPYYGAIASSLLTNTEEFPEEDYGKWCLGDWRLGNFTSCPHSNWPYGEQLCQLVENYIKDRPGTWKHPKFDYCSQPKEDFDVVMACVMALREPEFLKALERFDLTDDFEFGVFHSNDEQCECNFVLDENQDLSCLVEEAVS